MAGVRVGLVSPYSYTYPGGVGRHVEALSQELLTQGHEVRLLAPYDPDDRLARAMHRGARPERRPLPDYVVPLGRTVGLPANGAVSNLSVSTQAVAALGRELRNGGYDVIHVHEPNAPAVSWFATEAARVPVVATFHAYSTSPVSNRVAARIGGAWRLYNKLNVRIAVSEAARWTAERYYGGNYRIVPNGVDLSAARSRQDERASGDELEILFVGRAEGRKGLPVLLRACEALRGAGVRARLTVAGATEEEVDPLLFDREGVTVAGRVSEEEKWELLARADVLCAPSLGGESFGMVLTEAFASGTPVVASDIAGYRDVVRGGVDGMLVPPAEPAALGEALRGLALDPARRAGMAAAARERAQRFGWPRVTGEGLDAYADAQAVSAPQRRAARAATRIGMLPADGAPARPPRRIPSLEAKPAQATRRSAVRIARRVALFAAAAGV
ncbi:MAG TPA: glycosyltransferase family 4 protein, partial [Solirubrobacteraceae bacterium]|nr:glycosyltransferase family 4 protein [Solirubrobacteraceae bacterium]